MLPIESMTECEISRSAFTDRLALHATLPSAFEARRHNEIRSIREDVMDA